MYVAFMPIRSLRCALSSAILDWMSGFDMLSDAVRLAVFAHCVYLLESEPVSQKSRPREVATCNGISQARLLKGSR